MARPSIPAALRRVTRDVTLSPETWAVIDTLAAARGLNQSRTAEMLIDLGLRSLRRISSRNTNPKTNRR